MYATDSKSIRTVIVGIIAAGLLQAAHALGLGPITVNSHIGEPLRATIDVTGLDRGQAANTTVSVADTAAYQRRGIKKLPSHDQLNLSLQSGPSGNYISISTPNMVREPFITFVLSIKHDGKETLREYTVFLDPATDNILIPSTPAPAASIGTGTRDRPAPVNAKLLVDEPATANATGWKGKPAKIVATEARNVEKENWQGSNYGPVQKGETLFSIANKVRPSADYSIQTIMRQIYHANPRAFSSNQLNSLMAGYNLSIPVFTKDLVAMPSSKSAKAVVSAQPIETKKDVPDTVAEIREAESDSNQSPVTDPIADTGMQADSLVTEEQPIEEVVNDTNIDRSDEQVSFADGSMSDLDEVIATEPDGRVEESDSLVPDILENGQVGNEPDGFEAGIDSVTDQSRYNGTSTTSIDVEDTIASQNDESINLTDDTLDSSVNTLNVTESQVVEEPLVTDIVQPDLNTEIVVEEQPVVAEESPVVVTEESPVIEESSRGFLTTTYAFLPMWQWLLVGVFLLAIIALFLFKQRKKHAVNELDTLDDAEMDAVLAKINSLENDENEFEGISDDEVLLNDQSDWHENADEFGQEDDVYSMDREEFAQELQDEEMVFDDLHDFESDPDMFFNEDEVQKLDKKESLTESDSVFEGDDDFFMEDDDTASSSDFLADLDIDDSSQMSLDKDESISSDDDSLSFDTDDLDFFVSDVDEEDKPASNLAETSSSTDSDDFPVSEEEFDFDDLFINENELEEDLFDFDSLGKQSDISSGNTDNIAVEDSNEDQTAVNPEEMEINLDLAVSFIATGHGERAITWLEEVIEVGNDEQKARAQALLDKARGG